MIANHVDDVVDVHEISYTIFNHRRDFLSYMLGCSPHNIDKIKEFDINGGMGFSVLRLSGTIEFDDFGKLPVVEHDVLVSRLVSATTDLFGAEIDRVIDIEPLLEEIGYDFSIDFRIDGVDDVTATIKETRE